MKRALALLAALCALTAPAAAQTLAFGAASLENIRAQYAGRPFILALWSANGCTYCAKELVMLGELVKQHPDLPVVFVSTDGPEFAPQMEAMLASHGLAGKPSWVFDDEIPERPRRAIDPQWRGEVPRTYLYDARHAREAVPGLLGEARLRAWMASELNNNPHNN